MPVLFSVLKEELERNLRKQIVFKEHFNSLPKGYLSICIINGKQYVYRKRRDGNKIVSEYIGIPGDDNVKRAIEDRENYLKLKQSIKWLEEEEKKLRRAVKDYGKICEGDE